MNILRPALLDTRRGLSSTHMASATDFRGRLNQSRRMSPLASCAGRKGAADKAAEEQAAEQAVAAWEAARKAADAQADPAEPRDALRFARNFVGIGSYTSPGLPTERREHVASRSQPPYQESYQLEAVVVELPTGQGDAPLQEPSCQWRGAAAA